MFEDDLEGISDDDIENILEKDEGESKPEEEEQQKSDVEEKPVAKQPTKVDALDIAWDSLRGEAEEKQKQEELPEKTDEGIK